MGGQVTFAEELKFFSDAWREKAQRDDLFNEMVPSDFRIAIQYITEASETIFSLEAENARLREAQEELRKVAAMLQQNAEGCVYNHYSENFGKIPGWLIDTAAVIQKTTAALSEVKEKEK